MSPVRIGPGVIKPDVVRPPGTGRPGIIKKPTPVMPKRPGQ